MKKTKNLIEDYVQLHHVKGSRRWRIYLIVGNQSFRLEYTGTKKEVEWMKDMLGIALTNIVKGAL